LDNGKDQKLDYFNNYKEGQAMFTGLIEKQGILKRKITQKNMYKLTFYVDKMWKDLELGESIAVNGVCLTVTEFTSSSFTTDISLPTLRDSSMYYLNNGMEVNLERSLQLGDRLGGHIVQGHVDGVGKVISSTKKDTNLIIKIAVDYKLHKLIARKASIAVDGVSLTVQDVASDSFTIVIIPHSVKCTNLLQLKIGDKVNIEIDVLAKYVEHFLGSQKEDKPELRLWYFF
jgi:riboflavin synthase